MRYFLTLSYKGTRYSGWQVQPGARTVQGTLNDALATLLRSASEVVGAGRTDSGVHALKYTAHFDAPQAIADPEAFCYHLNAILPPDVAVHDVIRVRDDAHARFDALSREYEYRIMPCKDPFTRESAWQYYVPLDVEKMNEAAACLLRYADFTTFAKLHASSRTNICRVEEACWRQQDGMYLFTIRADRFLRNMVRAIVGTLVGVGRGKITPQRFEEIVAARDLSLAGSSAPAQGLFFLGATYPAAIFDAKV